VTNNDPHLSKTAILLSRKSMPTVQHESKNGTIEVFFTMAVTLVQVTGLMAAGYVLTGEQRHILACVDTILHRHFTPEHTLLLSMPRDGHDFGQRSLGSRSFEPDHAALAEFSLKSIYEKNIWNLQISRPGVEIFEDSLEETDRHHNYIIYIILYLHNPHLILLALQPKWNLITGI
jgi:hypothetical protein